MQLTRVCAVGSNVCRLRSLAPLARRSSWYHTYFSSVVMGGAELKRILPASLYKCLLLSARFSAVLARASRMPVHSLIASKWLQAGVFGLSLCDLAALFSLCLSLRCPLSTYAHCSFSGKGTLSIRCSMFLLLATSCNIFLSHSPVEMRSPDVAFLPILVVRPQPNRATEMARESTGVPGGHDTHRPFTNRKAAPGEGTVIRARVGRPIPFRARSAQGPVHFPPTWRVMMRRCHPGQPGQGRRARAEGGMGAKREGANGVECTDGGWRGRRGGKGGRRREDGGRHGRAVGG